MSNQILLFLVLFHLPLSILIAYGMDGLFGDPKQIPHPVIAIGRLIGGLERLLLRTTASQSTKRIAGAVLWILTVGTSFLLPFVVLRMLFARHLLIGIVAETLLIWLGIAKKTLGDEANEVYRCVAAGDLDASRVRIGYLVGRETDRLSFEEIIRATVETVAENTVDGVTAPLFYAMIGGAPLLWAYKAVNTLDSMVGYKNDRYADFGYVSAKLDDLFNWIPARLTFVGFILAAAMLGYDSAGVSRITLRDHKNHKSPNAGWSEAAVAGALGVQLGGNNVYFGQIVEKPTIGDKTRSLEPQDIIATVRLMQKASDVMLLCYILIPITASVQKFSRIAKLVYPRW